MQTKKSTSIYFVRETDSCRNNFAIASKRKKSDLWVRDKMAAHPIIRMNPFVRRFQKPLFRFNPVPLKRNAKKKSAERGLPMNLSETVATCVRIDAVEYLVGGDVQINTELTLSNGKYAYYVNCSAGEKYNIHTMIYEKGYRECRPAFKSGAERYATIRGRWSPDCLGTYIDATGLER